jgi:hypothetical protein
MRIRLVLQPIVAAFFAIRSGLRDVREGRPPYFWALVLHAPGRGRLLREGWRDVGKVLLAAVAIDLIYQTAVLRKFRPLEAVAVAILLAIVPYVVFRGPVNRLLRARR